MNEKKLYSNNTTARIAGLLYLVVVITGIFSLAYVPSKLIVKGDAAATVQNIISSESLFRLGILSSAVCYTFFLFLPLVLYKLLRQINENHAKAMVILAVVSVPISFVNLINRFAVLTLLSGTEYLKTFDSNQLQTQILFYLDLYRNGLLVVQIFWGLWLFPFGYLVYKSQMIPKILGILLILGCFGYVIDFIGSTIVFSYNDTLVSQYVTLPAGLGEIGICFWLLIFGIKNKPILNINEISTERQSV